MIFPSQTVKQDPAACPHFHLHPFPYLHLQRLMANQITVQEAKEHIAEIRRRRGIDDGTPLSENWNLQDLDATVKMLVNKQRRLSGELNIYSTDEAITI